MKVPGIGKKTAERLLLELKGKLGDAIAAPTSVASHAQGDMDRLRTRLDRLLGEIETLVAHGNAVRGTVERGAKDIGSAASAVGYTAQRAMEVGSFEVRAVTAAVKTGLQWFRQSPGGQRGRTARPAPAPGAPSRLDPDIAAR